MTAVEAVVVDELYVQDSRRSLQNSAPLIVLMPSES